MLESKKRYTYVDGTMLNKFSTPLQMFLYSVIKGITDYNGTGFLGNADTIAEKYEIDCSAEQVKMALDELQENGYIDIILIKDNKYCYSSK